MDPALHSRVSRLRPRFEGLPQDNTIQNPALSARIAEALGLRQGHVTPSLSSVLSPVLVIGDITKSVIPIGRTGSAGFYAPDFIAAGGWQQVSLLNPVGSSARILNVRIAVHQNTTTTNFTNTYLANAAQRGVIWSGATLIGFPNASVDTRDYTAVGGVTVTNTPLQGVVTLAHFTSDLGQGAQPAISERFLGSSTGGDRQPMTVEEYPDMILEPGFCVTIRNRVLFSNGLLGFHGQFSWREEPLTT